MKDLFGNDIILPDGGSKEKGERIATHQYRQLISIYGKTTDKTCKQCKFGERYQAGSKIVYKCAKAKISNSQATDWNSRWTACGLFEPYFK